MKLSTLVTGFAFTFTGVICQLTAPMQNYNVSSPVPNGPYVVGQVIPCTIELFENVMTDIALSINLVPSTAGTPGATNVTSFPIASTVDVSKSSDSMKRNGNLTYYEHSVNYQIPSTVPAGSYNVVFFDSRTNTHLDVPINVRPAAAASASLSGSAAGAAATAGTSGNQRGSTFKSSNDVSAISPFKKTIIALVTVAATAAFML